MWHVAEESGLGKRNMQIKSNNDLRIFFEVYKSEKDNATIVINLAQCVVAAAIVIVFPITASLHSLLPWLFIDITRSRKSWVFAKQNFDHVFVFVGVFWTGVSCLSLVLLNIVCSGHRPVGAPLVVCLINLLLCYRVSNGIGRRAVILWSPLRWGVGGEKCNVLKMTFGNAAYFWVGSIFAISKYAKFSAHNKMLSY